MSSLIDDLRHHDVKLLSVLLEDKFVLREYSKEIDGKILFDFQSLIDLFKYHNFWQDSYTKFSNKIGLATYGHYLSDDSNVVLDFPFKDTILKGGMTKEDKKNGNVKEPYLNEIISRNKINEMFEPKALIHAKKYDKNGKHQATNFNDQDNLILKGNNLIALHSLKKRYAGKIKLIYIDPPYNTGNDSFEYNDNFNQSSWLVFMKNRLEIAKELLSSNGFLVVQTDDNEQAYLKVLMDEIFGRKYYINTVSVLMKNIAGASGGGQDKRLKKNIEYLTIYTKNDDPTFNKIYSKEEMSQLLKRYKRNGKSFKYNSVLINSGKPQYLGSTQDSKGNLIKIYNRTDYKIDSLKSLQHKYNLSTKDIFKKYGDRVFQTALPQSSIRSRVINEYKNICDDTPKLISIRYTPQSGKHKGEEYEQFYKGKNFRLLAWLHDVSVTGNDGQLYKTQQLGTFWNMVGFTNNVNREGQVSFNNGKKPEHLLYNLIKLTTDPHDIVLDFFAGSGTTQAASMKMNRNFIGIEQMDYINSLLLPRLENVINGEQSGVSKNVNWHGGGSFIYAELMNKNQHFINALEQTTSQSTLDNLYEDMKSHHADLDIHVDLKNFEKEKEKHSLNDQKKMLIQMINKNQLYYNYHNLDDKDIKGLISKDDYKFNQSFYNGKGDEQ